MGCLGFLLPAAAFLITHREVARKLLGAAAYFFFVGFLMELLMNLLGYWTFPGTHYIGWITLFGKTLPYEELFSYIVLYPLAFLSYYEYFLDDEK